MVDLPDVLACPSPPAPYDQKASGTGHGLSKDAALSAARTDADTQLDMNVQCGAGCGDPVIVVTDPVYDDGRPVYAPLKRGWTCTASRARSISVECKAKG